MTAEAAIPPWMTDNDEEPNAPLSYTAWMGMLTDHARAALVAAQRQPTGPAGSPPGQDRHSPSPLSQIVDLITEVRDLLLNQRVVRDYYSTEQAAKMLGKANWTVREWCRQGRIYAEKRYSGRGKARDWVISHAELQRIEKEGLLPSGKH